MPSLKDKIALIAGHLPSDGSFLFGPGATALKQAPGPVRRFPERVRPWA